MDKSSTIATKPFGYLICCLFIFLSCAMHAQDLLRGTVLSNENGKPLPYVNIGIVHRSLGTVTDEHGNFNFFIPADNHKDSIQISMIGFESRTFLVREFIEIMLENPTIKLNGKAEELLEVVVSNRKLKTKILGNRSTSRKNYYEASAEFLGSEVGVKIKIKRAPTYLKKFNVRMLTKKHERFKFRLNIYNIKDGLPNQNLLKDNIIVDARDIKEGQIEVNLEPYEIYVEDDFFVTLEWIQGDGKKKLRFPANLFGPQVVERATSHAKWNKHSLASIGFNVTVTY